MKKKQRVCPVCKLKYAEYPALSRRDNKAEICPDCGVKEAFHDFFLWKRAGKAT
jgi:RNA polymerase subunit RPABC4/transcription elongation factor Spt4